MAEQLTETTSATARFRPVASLGRYQTRTSVLAPVVVKYYHHRFRLPTTDSWPS